MDKLTSESKASRSLTVLMRRKFLSHNTTDHQYENCPTWRQCGFCDKQGHWSFHCTTLHIKCTQYHCRVHIGHRNIGDMCPWSKEVKRYNFRYDCKGAVVDLVHAHEIYGPELDWSSLGFAM